jgi:hypothetical protein
VRREAPSAARAEALAETIHSFRLFETTQVLGIYESGQIVRLEGKRSQVGTVVDGVDMSNRCKGIISISLLVRRTLLGRSSRRRRSNA